ALEVIKKPQNTPSTPEGRAEFKPQLIDGSFDKTTQILEDGIGQATKSAISLPFYGKIAAGTPIEALRDNSRTIEVPTQLLGRGEHYALEIEGDSMIEAGILAGDVVLIKRTDTAENGEIVVALVDGHEATLKRLRRRGASVALEPANKSHETRIFGPDQVRVQGKLVGLVRNY
ncbi:MAG: transcriptional repressor LexA, partial [Pseudomonadota bacterium]|nr:transcriptional repressor LexA [Pseudomonadota bacterium]